MEKQQLGEQLWQLRVSLLRLAVSIVGNGHDAEDAVSGAMMKAMSHADDLRSPDSLKPWVMRITARCCYDLLRRRKRETPVCLLPETPVLQAADSLMDDIRALDPKYARPLILYYYEGMSAPEIASVLHLPRTAVSMRLSRGRKMLKECLKEASRDD